MVKNNNELTTIEFYTNSQLKYLCVKKPVMTNQKERFSHNNRLKMKCAFL